MKMKENEKPQTKTTTTTTTTCPTSVQNFPSLRQTKQNKTKQNKTHPKQNTTLHGGRRQRQQQQY